jgi:hypothetical protein
MTQWQSSEDWLHLNLIQPLFVAAQKYMRMAAHDKKRYEKEMAAYNAKK